jgi:hypothetical protein
MTSIEWLIDQCPRIKTIASLELIEQAKEMEKKDIIEAFENRDFVWGNTTGETYYKQKFKQD